MQTDQIPKAAMPSKSMNTSQPKGVTISILILVSVLTALLAGAAIYFWQDSVARTNRDELQSEISDLRSEIVTLEAATSSSSTSETSTSSAEASSLPADCTVEEEGDPVITSLSVYAGSVGDVVEINGCNFSGFEGDLNAWVENSGGELGILYGESTSTDTQIVVILPSTACIEDTTYSGLPCSEEITLDEGSYMIFTAPWGVESNKVEFEVI